MAQILLFHYQTEVVSRFRKFRAMTMEIEHG